MLRAMVLYVFPLAPVIGFALGSLLLLSGAPFWLYYVVLPLLALICYTSSCLLTRYFIRKRAPEFASTEEVFRNLQMWEFTAGLAIVPKWVSFVGLMSISCLLALLFPTVAALLR